jgi:hypothetical protein
MIKNNTNNKAVSTPSTMTVEQLRDLLTKQPDLVAELRAIENAEVNDLAAQLDQKYSECKALLVQIKNINPDFSAPWNKAPQAEAYAIKDYLEENGGTATTQDIIGALAEKHGEQGIQKTLTNRCTGKRPMWKYDSDNNSYTLN